MHVRQTFVTMWMSMLDVGCNGVIMLMLVIFIVYMLMFMPHRFMRVSVFVAFGQM